MHSKITSGEQNYILIVTNILPGQLGKSALHMWPLQKDVAALTPNLLIDTGEDERHFLLFGVSMTE